MIANTILGILFTLPIQNAESASSQSQARLVLVNGDRVTGPFVDISKKEVRILEQGKPRSISLDQVMRIDFGPPSAIGKKIRVRLTDGSRFGCTTFSTNRQEAKMMVGDTETTLPIHALSAVLLSDDRNEISDWLANAPLPRRTDRIVLARDDRKLALDGTIGVVGEEKAQFTLDGDELPINRSRVLSLYYAQQKSATQPVLIVTELNGNTWVGKEYSWEHGVHIKLLSGPSIPVPQTSIASIDFAPAKVTYLSDLEANLFEHTPAFDQQWPMLRDRNFHGNEIEIGSQKYSKGIVLHSRSAVEYALEGKFTRFDAQVGVESSAERFGSADVKVLVDGKVVWSKRITSGARAESLTIPISGASKLRLEVEFGPALDVGDHIAFGNARLVK